MTNNDFSILSKPQYYADLVKRINTCGRGDVITLATMSFEPNEPGMPATFSAVCEAAKRGAATHLVIDAYNFLVDNNKFVGPLWFFSRMPQHTPPYFRKKLNALHRLERAGGRVTITNLPSRVFSQPFGGRSHIKYAVINDYVYVGGCNLNASDNIDLMVGWQDTVTSAWLTNFAQDVDKAGSVLSSLKRQDISRRIDGQTELLIDAGVRHQSLIYDKALSLIDQAEESVFITCQLFPNSRTVRHLIDAHKRSVKITIIFNHPLKHKFHYPLHQIVTWRERARAPATFFTNQLPIRQPYLHAKLLATEKSAMIGSHNYVPSGVAFGTAEIALLRHDQTFATKAIHAIKSQFIEK